MNWARLPPAGDRVTWERGPRNAVRGLFAPWHATLFGSGTQALAAALLALRERWPARDEVIFAAYNCPALVSATVYAGCHPVLVDYESERPWMDLRALAARLSTRTLAVIAVDLLGIPERHAELRGACARVGCALVQDGAQGFPSRAGERGWQGDVVVLSFGRGKPVSLLTGGAVLTREDALHHGLARLATPGEFDGLVHALKVRAYNLLRHPWLYRLPTALPGLHLGETRYVALQGVSAMPAALEAYLPPAVNAFRRAAHPQALYPALLAGGSLLDLPTACRQRAGERLSRYPVLAPDRATRDRMLGRLASLGVSALYGAILPQVPGVAAHLSGEGVFPAAESFASRLLTLPNHDGVKRTHISRLAQLLRRDGPVTNLAEAEA
ncbi:MAG: DegT/DnrJ/EryC1/StrS family aminotransferase [Thiohalomonadaceae bacterium]